jgi:hypothetical protein
MSDDASYSSFLEKANADADVAKSQPRTSAESASAQSSSSAVPAALRDINATYASDTDLPFTPVTFNSSSSTVPSAAQFAELLDDGLKWEDVEELSAEDFDPRGEYSGVIKQVKGAVEGDEVKIFRVQKGETRAEYYVVGVKGKTVVGVKAEAVES